MIISVITPSVNNLLDKLDSWGPLFKISFQLKVNSFGGSPSVRSDQSLLHFTATNTNGYKKAGERIPAVFVFTDGTLGFRTNIGSTPNWHKQVKWDVAGGWQDIEISQLRESSKVNLFQL